MRIASRFRGTSLETTVDAMRVQPSLDNGERDVVAISRHS